MKRFLVRMAVFFAIVAAVDFSLGKVFSSLQAGKAGGRTGVEYYACRKATEEVIVMGSSKASHHYVPALITEGLGMSCFNAGQDGNGIILQYGRWKMLSERYAPKLLIYDINPTFDLGVNDNMTYLDRLKPFSGDRAVADYIASLFPLERIKLLSGMYRFNYKFLELAADCLRKGDYLSDGGYIPLTGRIRPEIVAQEPAAKLASLDTDPVKLGCLEQLLREAKDKGTEVIFVVSPAWRGGNYTADAYRCVSDLARSYGAGFYEYVDSALCDEPDLFEDSSHLNDLGARAFTKDLVSRISK